MIKYLFHFVKKKVHYMYILTTYVTISKYTEKVSFAAAGGSEIDLYFWLL
jgi:hypothetical protein